MRAAVPTFREQRGGDVVIVSSVAGLRGGPWEAVYAGTKHAQLGLAGSLDRELREHGIHPPDYLTRQKEPAGAGDRRSGSDQ